jgi:hypothetical protein
VKNAPGRKPFVPPTTREEEILARLGSAEDMLRYATDVDHYCEDPKCTVQTPQCRDRHAEAALDEIRRLLEPPHISLQPKRMSNDAERIYAERWKKENERQPAINSGFTALEHILLPDGQRVPERVTQRDAVVAASVIQWLGTSCGHCFVLQCEKEVEAARVLHSKWKGIEHRREYPEAKDEHTVEAEQIVGKLWSVLPPEAEKLRAAMAKLVAAALQAAVEKGARQAQERVRAALAAAVPGERLPGEERRPV